MCTDARRRSHSHCSGAPPAVAAFSPHDSGMDLLASGADLATVQHLPGHDTSAATARRPSDMLQRSCTLRWPQSRRVVCIGM